MGTESDLKDRRRRAAAKRRRLIFNDDGGSARVASTPWEDPRDFLHLRTTPLVGSQVDTINYCTTAGTFGRFYHDSGVSEVASDTAGRYRHSAIPGLIELGTDPLRMVSEFAAEHRIELFWSLRMNDTHDAGNPLLVSDLKKRHPELVFGAPDDRPNVGTWTSVDYARQEIRDRVLRYVSDVVDRYDVDGVDLDFFRHPVFFARQGRAELTGESPETSIGEDELNTMTGLIRQVRELLDAKTVSTGREKPLLLSVLVPDSVEYCRRIGIDIDRWLGDGLVDLLETTGYFRLNRWEYSVELGRRYGVPVHACLSEARLSDEEGKSLRNSREAYRGRAMQAWAAGVDGICMFNFFNARDPLFRELGSADTLSRLSKRYFPSVRGIGKPAGRPVPYVDLMKIPTLSPDHPASIEAGGEVAVPIIVGNEPGAAATDQAPTGESGGAEAEDGAHGGHGAAAVADLFVRMREGGPTVDVCWNGSAPGRPEESGEWLRFRLAPEAVRRGDNTLTVRTPDRAATLLDAYLELRYGAG